MPGPLTGIAAKMASVLVGAAASKTKTFWLRNHEGAQLIRRLQRSVGADAAVHHEVRDELARVLPEKIRTDPAARGALVLLLSGEQVESALAALAEVVGRLMQDSVSWPDGFTSGQFGTIVAGHALEAVNDVKASDRDAAHVDAKHTRERIEDLPGKFAKAMSDAAKLPLTPPFNTTTTDLTDATSLLEILRASERRFQLVGREDVMQNAKHWLDQPPPGADADHRVMIIHGPGGAGKTRLAGEILTLAESDGWVAGFLTTPESGPVAWYELSHPSQRLAIAIDYSEARRADLQKLFREAPVGHLGSAPLRVILLVREDKIQSETWATRLGGPVDLGPRGHRLLADQEVEVISLVDSLPNLEDRGKLWCAAGSALGNAADPPSYLADSLFERPLYLLLDAHRHSVESSSGDHDLVRAPTAQQLLDGVLRHERNYWVKARRALQLDLDESRMNQVAVVATLVGGASRSTFELALSALAWLADDDELRRRVVQWWGAVYATSKDTVRGIEPDIVGEYLVIRALGDSTGPRDQLGGLMTVTQLTELAAKATLLAGQRILRVLTRISTSEDFDGAAVARTTLGEILSRHLDELLPSAFDSVGIEIEHTGAVGESLSTTVAAAAVAANALSLLAPASRKSDTLERGEHDDQGDAARDAALQLIRRQVERIATQELEAGRWSSARYLEIVQWAVALDLRSGGASRAAQRIVEISTLVPRPHRQLAGLLLEMGRHHAENGQYGEAENAYREALDERFYRQALQELSAVESDDARYSEYVIQHDLGDIAEGRGDRDTAIECFEDALAGKTRARGLANWGTIITLESLTEEIAKANVDQALERLREAREQLADHADHLVHLDEHEVTLLSNAGRFDEATAVARRIQEARTDVLVRRAILESISDPTTDANVVTGVALQAAVLASHVFTSGDLRLAVLASRLADAIAVSVGTLIVAQMSESAIADLMPPEFSSEISTSLPSGYESFGEFEATFRKMVLAIPNYLDFVNEGIGLLAAAVERALNDPVISSLSYRSTSGSPASADDRATRHWLARTVFIGPGDEETRKQNVASLLVFYMHLRLNGSAQPPLVLSSLAVWSASGGEDIAKVEQERLVEELQQAGEMDVSPAQHLVAAAKARMVMRAARSSKLTEDWEDAERLFLQALDELSAIGEGKTNIAYAIQHDLGDVAVGRGDHDTAIERFEEALAGKIDSGELASEGTLATLGRIVEELARVDVDKAIERLHDARRQMESDDHPDYAERLYQQEIISLANAGRLEQAAAVARQALRMRAGRDLRGAFRDLIADPITVEDTPTPLATVMCVAAAGIISADDPRLAALASRLTDIVMTCLGILMLPHMQGSALKQIASLGHGRRPGAEAADIARRLQGASSELKDTMEVAAESAEVQIPEALEIVKSIAGEVLQDPEFSSLYARVDEGEWTSPVEGPRALADNHAVRRWLARTVFASSSDDENREEAIAHLLTLYVGLRLDMLRDLQLSEAGGAIWSSPESDEAVEVESAKLLEDLLQAGESDASTAQRLLRAATATAMFAAARELERETKWDEAERLYARALDELTKMGRQNTHFAYVTLHDLGDVAAARGEQELAVSRFEQALEGKIGVLPDRWDPDVVTTLLKLADVISLTKPDAARRRIQQAVSEASGAGATEQAARMQRWLGA
jgi:tetratricopeptide (TPR) repeat protein